MATKSSDSYSTSPSFNNNKYDKYLYQNNAKIIQRKPIFAPILEEPGDILNNLQDLNTSSIPMGNNNNNSSFENSMNGIHLVDYHTMNKFRPSLNLSCLPPVFEIPKNQIQNKNNLNNLLNITNNQSINNNSLYNDSNNLNIKLMRGSRLNLKPIMNNSNINLFNNTAGGNNNLNNNKSNFISLPPINNHTNYNKLKDIKNDNQNNYKINNNFNFNNNSKNNASNIKNFQQRKKQYLKPIQMGKNLPYKNNLDSYNNIHEVRRTLDVNRDINNNFNLNKNGNQSKYYYNLNNKNIIKNEKLKEERALRNKEMSNISINQNKNYVDKNIVILNNKDSKINNNNIINNFINANIEDFVPINKNKTRVIHIPTLKIYDKFDIPAKKYIFYENYIKNWAKMVRGTLKIKNIIENNNINYYHIIVERTKNGSLGNLIRTVGSLNEYIIMFISKQLIPLIKIYNKIFDYRFTEINEQLYNYIDIDNIWFNSQYNINIYPGKLNKIQKNTKNIKDFLTKLYNLNNNQNNKIIKDMNDENLNFQLNIDLMNFGITLININIFILNISVNDLFELIKENADNAENSEKKSECCLFHYFYNNIKLFSNFYDSLKQNNELSENYFDFVHNLTSFNITENNYEKISNHPFINKSPIVNEDSNINELIKIGKMYDFSNEYYTSNSNIISYDLICNNIIKKLGNYTNYYENYNITDTKTLFNMNNIEFEELCKELRVNFEELHDKLLVHYENLFENKD